MLDRRDFLGQSLSLSAAAWAASSPLAAWAAENRPRKIVLRSSWQSVNIGDIGHTPGALRLLETYLPDVQVTLWPSNLDHGVDAMLQKAFPRVRIAQGRLDSHDRATTPELRTALEEADLLLHGSGPSVVAWKHLAAWRRMTRKPFGIYGVTVGEVSDELRDLLSAAAFVFCRDTVSLDVIRRAGVTCPIMEFAPDATFAIDLRDEPAAEAYLKSVGLEPRKFLCAIPRLRITPYFKIHNKKPTAEDLQKQAVSEQFKEVDHAKLRGAIVTWVRKTGLPVLACPEMTYEVELAKEVLVDPLPADVKPKVVWRDHYWRPDEAGSVYARARAVVSFEMHSPIIAAAMGTPAFYLRQPTDTSKGQMWRDIGLSPWIFEIDETRAEDISDRLLELNADYPAALARLAKAMEFVAQRQRESMAVVGRSLPR